MRAHRSWTLSGELWAVTSKFDGKGEKPVPEAKMAALAEYVAYLKELPSQVCAPMVAHSQPSFVLLRCWMCMFSA